MMEVGVSNYCGRRLFFGYYLGSLEIMMDYNENNLLKIIWKSQKNNFKNQEKIYAHMQA